MLKFTASRLRTVRRLNVSLLETLEARSLLTYTPLGYPLPDLVVQGGTSPEAAYGGAITVTADVSNLSHSAMIEPLSLAPGSVSAADAPATTVGVYLSPRSGAGWVRNAYKLGDIQVPALPQNRTYNLQASFAMPAAQPQGFPVEGGQLFVWFRANDSSSANEIDTTNNVSRAAQAVGLYSHRPQLSLLTAIYPPGLSPGASLAPQFQIGNYGTASPATSVVVELVASRDRHFGKSDLALATYTFANVPPISGVSSFGQSYIQDVNLDVPGNVVTASSKVVTLPRWKAPYYIGYVIDPGHQIPQISDLSQPRSNLLQGIQAVGRPIHGMPALNQVFSTNQLPGQFPEAAFGKITSPFISTVRSTWPAATPASTSSVSSTTNSTASSSTSGTTTPSTTPTNSPTSETPNPSNLTGSPSVTEPPNSVANKPIYYGVKAPKLPRHP